MIESIVGVAILIGFLLGAVHFKEVKKCEAPTVIEIKCSVKE